MEQKLTIDRLFTDHMVLQREKPIKLWGTCTGTEAVKIFFRGNIVEADIQGQNWTAVLPPMEAV